MEMKKTEIGIAVILLLAVVFKMPTAAADKKTYIVHMEHFDQMKATLDVEEHRYFESSLECVSDEADVMYRYENTLHGFATVLTDAEAEALKDLPQVISVFPETKYELHTTRSPWFLGLDQQPDRLPNINLSSNVIVGVFDTGVWPESDSFNDDGFPSIPTHWRGACENGTNFTQSMCNKKLIGARFFSKGYEAALGDLIDWDSEYRSPRDNDGHGTHTSTTAAGSAVPGASLFGYANGTARGMAEYARVAAYKVCWTIGCFGSDILAGIEQAIADNVDVMSLSLGSSETSYLRDSIAVGAFAAVAKGIFVSCSAGNSGPDPFTVSNTAPWITSVGAGTLDRDFPAPVTLGNGKIYSGMSIYSGRESLGGQFVSFVYAGNATKKNGNVTGANLCFPETLDSEKVKGKIVLCDRGINPRVEKGLVVKEAGGRGMILANTAETGEELVADSHLCLATAVGEKAGNAMRHYLFSDPDPTVTISFDGTKLGVKPAPVVAAFSSRGPNAVVPEILKPDLIAPGVNILAGWAGDFGPTGLRVDTRRVPYNIMSGTSMSCPHVSGLAAMIKAKHPRWSPAAIRSALMTTAYTAYEDGNPILDIATGNASTALDYGAGHVNPIAALSPGLVYDINRRDYLNFLCALNYTSEQIRRFGKTDFRCKKKKVYNVNYLNYPSFAVSVPAKTEEGNTNVTVVKHKRKLTNVGIPGRYKVSITSSSQLVKISVVPATLTFSRAYEVKSYTVKFRVYPNKAGNQFGRIEWKDDEEKHVVRSPVAVSWIDDAYL